MIQFNQEVMKLRTWKKEGKYKYGRVKRGWIVVNCKSGNHAHFRSEFGCYLILKFIKEGIYPNNTYLRESWRRLTEEKKERQKYINIQKGVNCNG